MIVAREDRIGRLEALVAAFRQAMFGRKSEQLDPDQLELAFEDIETGIAAVEAECQRRSKIRPCGGAKVGHLRVSGSDGGNGFRAQGPALSK